MVRVREKSHRKDTEHEKDKGAIKARTGTRQSEDITAKQDKDKTG
jgi:hypothetical protein